jgi:glycosyltransferase involved in cell wall biosynthesis
VNICFALPDAWYGGIRTFALNLGRQFALDGHCVSAVIPARGVREQGLGDLSELRRVMEVSVCAQRRVLVRSRFLRRVIEAIEAAEPDVLILNHTLWAQAALPYLDPSVRRIVVVHGSTEEELELPRANSAYWDALVAVGPGLERQLLDQWGNEKVHLIPVGVPEPPFARTSDFSESVLKICYVGRVKQEQKNVFLIPTIARELVRSGVGFTWAVVGDGPDLNALVGKVSEAGVTELFEFVGGCDQARVQEILMRQHVLVLPSNWESIGHVLLEAQMLGVVPVASRLPGATDFVITHGHDGLLCEPGDSAGFVDALAFLSADRGALERLSLAAQRGVRGRFEISRIAAHYYDLFGSISRTNSQLRRRSSTLGYYPIPESLLPSRVRTAARLGRDLVLDRVRETEAGRGSIGS